MLAKRPDERWPSVDEAMRQVSGAVPVDGEEVRAAIAAAARLGQAPTVTLLPTTIGLVTPATTPVTVLPSALPKRSRRIRSVVGTVGTAMLAMAIFAPGKGRLASEQSAPATQGAPADSAFSQTTGSTARRDDAPPAVRPPAPITEGANRPSSRPRKRPQDEPTTSGATTIATTMPRNGSMLLGTRGLPAVLYVDGAAQGAVSGLRSWPLPAGTVRISIRLEGCVPWDSTVVVEPGNELRIGYRAPQCAS